MSLLIFSPLLCLTLQLVQAEGIPYTLLSRQELEFSHEFLLEVAQPSNGCHPIQSSHGPNTLLLFQADCDVDLQATNTADSGVVGFILVGGQFPTNRMEFRSDIFAVWVDVKHKGELQVDQPLRVIITADHLEVNQSQDDKEQASYQSFRGRKLQCIAGCNDSTLGDGICNSECNHADCNWDGEDCLCMSGCEPQFEGDGICQDACKNSLCSYDSGDCDCSSECSFTMQGDGSCYSGCNTEVCNWDNGDCDCSSGCNDGMKGDGNCDAECYNSSCDYDLGDCHCSSDCDPEDEGNGTCDDECNNSSCNYDSGDCDEVNNRCAEDCPDNWIGDGSCDWDCNVSECNYDNGDCIASGDELLPPLSSSVMLELSTVALFPLAFLI